MDQSGKKNAERYLVVTSMFMPMTVWAENFSDVLKELQEAAEQDGLVIREDDIISITKLDFGEGEE